MSSAHAGPTDAMPTGKLEGSAALSLAGGVVVLEFASAISTFVAGTLLPLIEPDLDAQHQVPLLVAGTTVGMFTALPLASRIIARISPNRVLMAGLLLSLLGAVISASASTAWEFAVGRFFAGFAGAVLAVYGVSAAIRHLGDSLRLRVVGMMSAMWILPALVGPSATLALAHLVGWRLALLAPLPLMVIGRLLVVRTVPPQQPNSKENRPYRKPLLIPIGVAAFIGLTQSRWWPLAPIALVFAIVGFFGLMPAGTGRLRRGAPAALAGLTLFGGGYFGANNLVTLMFTQTYHTTLFQAGLALSAAPIAWAVAALIAPKLGERGGPPAWGMALSAVAVAVVAVVGLAGGSWIVALVAWTLVGLGIGLSYPALYLRASTQDASTTATATQLATAVITTESFGGLIGSSAGAGFGSLSDDFGLTRADAWAWSFLGFAAVLAAATVAAFRSSLPKTDAADSNPAPVS